MKSFYQKMDYVLYLVSKLISYFTVILLLMIIWMVFSESIAMFQYISINEFILGGKWRPVSNPPVLGILNMILGTLYAAFLALIISLPISIGASLFICLFAKGKVKVLLLTFIDLLAGIPSVVYGFFSFMTLVLFFERKIGMASGESFFIAGVTLGVMILPLMVSTITQTMEKIYNKHGRQAKSLGVSTGYLIIYLILPRSINGIVIGISLGFSRALGETMAVIMVLGNSNLMPSLFGKGTTLSGLIALEMGSAVIDGLHYKGLYGAGAVLIVLLLCVNVIFSKIQKWVLNDE